MSEKQRISQPEQHKSHETGREFEDVQRERLREQLERAEKQHHEKLSEAEAVAQARQLAKENKPKTEQNASPAERRRGPISKKQLDNSFDAQMHHAREFMSPVSRTFSKIIHIKPIEKVSEVAGSTIARPNALLSGSIMAFVTITALYFTAKYYGFQLSGFETIGAFIIGWVIGIIYDYTMTLIRGQR